ncbi:16094_t:CDS:2 [Dentiscutata heterogama]|uniref:16094_t:CDS:1 n=1 Tax=Dentiscutata heterogama TaxID=1316150 RepID=A0ACA9K381_9GLOM|nr:16094_t:CDS:2 [Dentiscutata heterogama]
MPSHSTTTNSTIITTPVNTAPTSVTITTPTPIAYTGSSASSTTSQVPTSSYEPFLPQSGGNIMSNWFKDIELWISIGSLVIMWLF